jgi:predicted outer membrane protein
MKLIPVCLSVFALTAFAGAKEPAKKSLSTVPGQYPSIIKMTPLSEEDKAAPKGLIESELGGREMQFLLTANATGHEQLALAELARSKDGSEQIRAVADTLASTQETESQEVARLAAAKHVTLRNESAKALTDGLLVLSGGKFEKAWIERLIAVSEAAAAAYELGAKSDDGEIRSFAEKLLPVAKARLQMANRLGGRSVGAASPPPVPPPQTAQPPNDARQPIPPPISPSAPAKR